MGEAGREDEGCAVDRDGDMRLQQAGDVFVVGAAQGRRDRLLDGGQADDDDGLGVVEGGRRVEAEVESLALGEGDGRDVLVLRGVERGKDTAEIDDGSDIGGVGSRSGGLGVAGGGDEVGAGAGREGSGDGLTMAVVEQRLASGLGEAEVLLVDVALETIGVGAQREGAGEEVGVIEEGLRVAWGDLLDGGQVLLDASLLEPGLVEVLEARTKTPGRPRTADLRVAKSPPVTGARKTMACWASGGTTTSTPSSWTLRFQVSMRVNQSSGGGFVVPRRKATIIR